MFNTFVLENAGVILVTVVVNGYVLVTLIGAYAQYHDTFISLLDN